MNLAHLFPWNYFCYTHTNRQTELNACTFPFFIYYIYCWTEMLCTKLLDVFFHCRIRCWKVPFSWIVEQTCGLVTLYQVSNIVLLKILKLVAYLHFCRRIHWFLALPILFYCLFLCLLLTCASPYIQSSILWIWWNNNGAWIGRNKTVWMILIQSLQW